MSNKCLYIPRARNGKPSQLFRDINSIIKDREAAKRLWGFTRTDLFNSEFSDQPVDENGEITFEALREIIGLDDTLTRAKQDDILAKDTGIVSDNGSDAVFDSASDAMSREERYNSLSKESVAITTETNDGRYKIERKEKTPTNIAEADRDEKRRRLNTKLIDLINRMGFDVSFMDDTSYEAVFSPKNAERNVDNLKTVIKVANNEQGLDSIPEEVSHLVLAGLRGHEMKTRLDNLFTDDVVRNVLGSEYDSYYRRYSKGQTPVAERLRDEAEGKALAAMLKRDSGMYSTGSEQTSAIDSISDRKDIITRLKRLWEYVKNLFRKNVSTDEVDDLIFNAADALRPIADMVENDDIDTVIDKELIEKSEDLFDLNQQVQKIEQITQEGEAMLSKRLYILQNTQSDIDTKDLRKSIANIRDDIDKQRYYNACVRILWYIGNEAAQITRESKTLGFVHNGTTDLNMIRKEAELVRRISTVINGYSSYLTTLRKMPDYVEKGEVNMDPEAAERIAEFSVEYLDKLNLLNSEMKQLRYAVLKQLITLYYGDMGNAPETFEASDRAKFESVDTILRYASSDTSWWDTNVFSAGDSRNTLLNVIHKIVVSQQAKRNSRINNECAKLQEADARLRAAGHDSEFIYQKDENGIPTGYYVAPVDFAKFERDRNEFIKSLDERDDLDYYSIQKQINKWDAEHTEEIEVGEPDSNGIRRTEMMPRKYAEDGSDMYIVRGFQSGWSQEQKNYYDSVISMKAAMDSLLPIAMQGLYNAPQVRKEISQMFDNGAKDALRTIWGNWKKQYSITSDNMDYGNRARKTTLDFNNREIKRVPVYFIQKLENQKDLSTDGTHAMFNYIAMAVNYGEMNQLAAAMSLMQDYVSDTTDEGYEVRQTDGGIPVVDSFIQAGREYYRQLTKRGEGTNTAKAITTYIDRQFFNETKKRIGDLPIRIKGKAVSGDAIANVLLKLTSVSRIGFNVLSGITNITQGETQILQEATTGRYFGMKDYAWAKKEYGKLLPEYMGHFNSANRHDKMYMLINQFNSSEDFFRDMREKDFNPSALKRVMGRGNVFFLNSMGEHYLHTSGMLMVLRHEKVKRLSDNSEVSLYDVIKQVHDKNGWRLELDDDIQFLDTKKAFLVGRGFSDGIVKKEDKDKLFEGLAIYINNINAGMHGGYSEAEKGNINQHVLLQFFNQFRQWMWGMYNKLYSRPYYDAVMGVQREGVYYSLFKFFQGTLHDMKNMSIKEAINNNHLTPENKKALRIAYTQISTLCMLWLICAMTKGWKDDDDRARRLLAYSAKRLNLETGALSPWPPTFVKNVFTLVQSPAAGVKTLEGITQIFNIGGYWDEINSGRYKGWSKSAKALYTITPLYNVQKVIDMKDYNYMFNIFK